MVAAELILPALPTPKWPNKLPAQRILSLIVLPKNGNEIYSIILINRLQQLPVFPDLYKNFTIVLGTC